MSIETQPATSFAAARAELYDLLSRIFDGDVELLGEALESGALVDMATVLPADFDTGDLSRENVDVESLEVGYDNLFAVPGPYYVPPFASAHVTDPSHEFESDSSYHEEGSAGELLGDPAQSISGLYTRTGFTPDRGEGIPDHVAAELEFVAALAGHESAAIESEDETESTDLVAVQHRTADHLEWIHEFADDVGRVDTKEGVFAALATFTSAFVDWDRRQLEGRAD
ncbi:MAG: molecular chaperone [Halanaeroarchaeum sp.]